MIELDAATFLLQWAVGGMIGCWFTTRRREVGLGYGWMLRITFVCLAIASAALGWSSDGGAATRVRDVVSVVVAVSITGALVSSILRRKAGVRGQLADHDRRSQRIAEMTGIDRDEVTSERVGREFDPRLDLIAPIFGTVGLVAAGVDAGGNDALAVARIIVGAVFLGFVTDAMLLGHWYLVQPGLPRRHVNEIVRAFLFVWPAEVLVMLLPTGMFSVFSGAVDDGWGGQLGWFWAACAVTTGVLGVVTQRALRERSYSAVMAATGLMYLAILTAFGTDLVARAVLAG
ncbi:MAG: hypothetical protein B7C54_12350 [Acidimicrobiales bacterium mtb01]|nr:hypothetical protein [Actinomycetota bacterium]TEX45820.1 MAG: hypothetical protein B7C54_12350 [Acidimicrobiales bacterium mtb01]